MSRRQKKVLFTGGLMVIAFIIFGFFATSIFINKTGRAVSNNGNNASLPAGQVQNNPVSGNAFAPRNSDFFSAPALSNIITSTLAAGSNGAIPLFNGAPVKSLSDVMQVIAASSSSASSVITQASASLTLPSISDVEITISPSGTATALDYLLYFNEHAKDIAFNNNRLNSVLKDKNGMILFVPGLIEKAITDNNFGEIQSSLSVQKDFVEAEINFLKSMPVTGDAIALNKENIGIEELIDGLIDKAYAVAAGSLSKNDFINYYDQFSATTDNARQALAIQSGVLSVRKPESIFDRILAALGIGSMAKAQSVVNSPFGGRVLFWQPCTCSLGFNVEIGPPVAASLFIPDAFIASPLFFSYKSMVVSSWWLGLYNEATQLPCTQAPGCVVETTEIGGLIIMAGTSPPGA